MRTTQLIRRSLSYYWRTNLAMLLGVATAVSVLSGALLVGDSVKASLRDLFVQRLGSTDYVITAQGFFREELAADIQKHEQFRPGGFSAACPLIVLDGTITHEASRRVGSRIRVYGVDERFWKFHSRADASPHGRQVLVSESLGRELGASAGDSLLLRIEKPSDIPIESLHGRKEDPGSTLHLTVRETLAADALGEFSVQPLQGAVRAVFVPMDLLQKAINQEHKVNLILVSESSRSPSDQTGKTKLLSRILEERTSLEDFGITLRALGEQRTISLEQHSRMIGDSLANVAVQTGSGLSLESMEVFSYLANSIRSGDHSIPYSLVTALDESSFETLKQGDREKEREGDGGMEGRGDGKTVSPSSRLPVPRSEPPPIILNEWAARDLGAKIGDPVSIEYYLWSEVGQLETKTAQFRLAWIVPIKGLAADRDLVPAYPGITGSENLSDWDPPFPVDLKQIRKQDEDYWHQYRTTPKAFIPLNVGQTLWQSRFGKLTSVRFTPNDNQPVETELAAYERKLRAALNPGSMGFTVVPVRAQGLEASRGATDFGQYFLYFSFFLVVSALLLTALCFKLGVEQRATEIGMLQAIGFSAAKIRSLFLSEGLVLAVMGSLLGTIGAVGYGHIILLGLRTWWVGAVATTFLTLHVSALSLLLGGVGGVLAAVSCIVWTLRRLGRASARSLLAGVMMEGAPRTLPDVERRSRPARWIVFVVQGTAVRVAIALILLAFLLLFAATFRFVGQVGGFFGGGALLLVALLCFQWSWLNRAGARSIQGAGWLSVSRLGFRNANYRPGRSVLCIALIASATFIIVSVDAFRRDNNSLHSDRKSGSGGFPLLAESLLPLVHDPNTPAGREALNLAGDDGTLANAKLTRFRLRPGDDTSCLNLYAPREPRILATTDDFVRSNRFDFQSLLPGTREEAENPWLLLNRNLDGGAVPVIADANSMTYVLHLKVGDDLVLNLKQGRVRLRLVGALADSVFQSELLMTEKNFLRLFPEQQGYRFFLIDAPEPELSKITATLEDRLSDFGFDVAPTSERLANYHRVENTYLSTFQMLGGLGLVLGTLGMAAVLLRNVFERRRELALLRAVGYNSAHLSLMVIAENALLLFCGLATGAVCALLAIAPVFVARGGKLPNLSLGFLLLAVLISGLTASLVATWAALRSPLLPALRAE